MKIISNKNVNILKNPIPWVGLNKSKKRKIAVREVIRKSKIVIIHQAHFFFFKNIISKRIKIIKNSDGNATSSKKPGTLPNIMLTTPQTMLHNRRRTSNTINQLIATLVLIGRLIFLIFLYLIFDIRKFKPKNKNYCQNVIFHI